MASAGRFWRCNWAALPIISSEASPKITSASHCEGGFSPYPAPSGCFEPKKHATRIPPNLKTDKNARRRVLRLGESRFLAGAPTLPKHPLAGGFKHPILKKTTAPRREQEGK